MIQLFPNDIVNFTACPSRQIFNAFLEKQTFPIKLNLDIKPDCFQLVLKEILIAFSHFNNSFVSVLICFWKAFELVQHTIAASSTNIKETHNV